MVKWSVTVTTALKCLFKYTTQEEEEKPQVINKETLMNFSLTLYPIPPISTYSKYQRTLCHHCDSR
jgi:hypothetical protein